MITNSAATLVKSIQKLNDKEIIGNSIEGSTASRTILEFYYNT